MTFASLFQLLYFDLTFLLWYSVGDYFKMIGGIVMQQSNLEKQEAKLKQLNQKIKAEKNKIEQSLGKQIIKSVSLDYANLSNDRIKLLAKQFSEFLKENPVDHQS